MTLSLMTLFAVLLPGILALCAGLLRAFPLPDRFRDALVMSMTTGGVIISAFFAIILFIHVAVLGEGTVHVHLYNWFSVAHVNLSFGVWVDKLTATMLLVVSVISACVHAYSIGYMEEDKSKTRFFAYLSFFTFSMLALVSAPNLMQMFLGWEGVGLASYLLIGFWYEKESANAAGMKAFITNRLSDAVLLVGLFVLLATAGTLNYENLFQAGPSLALQTFRFFGYEFPLLELVMFTLFIGAMGKSAQIGFHVWLPDAMEGPTPVSALIHAATMVTAGVFLLCRLSPLLEYAPQVLELIAYVGAITAIFAATIGLTQRDIKRVIAYSTCSQLGYMFFAIGVSAYPAAMFHLTTHAFFKALLFLGAGSVIHALHHEQDMFKMGAVRKVLPVTYALMWIGSLALAGIPPFAGFFSKDLILESAFVAESPTGWILYALGTFGALLTAFYSFRVIFLTFHGEYQGKKEVLDHAHEAPRTMMIPMFVLALGAVLGGILLHDMGSLSWWHNSLFILSEVYHAHHVPFWAKYLPLAVALTGVAIAVMMYLYDTKAAQRLIRLWPQGYRLSLNKWYVDELYGAVLIRPLRRLSEKLWAWGDVRLIDGCGPHGVVWTIRALGQAGKHLQTGRIYHYAFAIVAGLCFLLFWLSFNMIK